RTIFTSGQDIEPPTGGHRTTLALAKCLCGAGDWLDLPGIPDHVVVIGGRHLRGILSTYVDYYNGSRTHLSLGKDAPEPRTVQRPTEAGGGRGPAAGGRNP